MPNFLTPYWATSLKVISAESKAPTKPESLEAKASRREISPIKVLIPVLVRFSTCLDSDLIWASMPSRFSSSRLASALLSSSSAAAPPSSPPSLRDPKCFSIMSCMALIFGPHSFRADVTSSSVIDFFSPPSAPSFSPGFSSVSAITMSFVSKVKTRWSKTAISGPMRPSGTAAT